MRHSITLCCACAVFVALPVQACLGVQLPVGFEAADANGSGDVSAIELKTYLSERLEGFDLPHQKIFDRLDKDGSGSIETGEFENRHGVIEHFMGGDFFGGGGEDFDDPGLDFVPYQGKNQPTHDGKIMGAVTHRFQELFEDESIDWPKAKQLKSIPESLELALSQKSMHKQPTVRDLIDATLIVGGGSGMGMFTAGAVLISEDGLAVTNYHVAEFLKEGRMAGLASDGKCYPIVEFLAGNADRDVALIRLQGKRFPHVNIAAAAPPIGDDIEVLHHSENRFYTYDRGYVMRYPTLGKSPWMEISADYAPGGSGCGIYNSKRELVGLVSIIQYGDGPSLSMEFDMSNDDFDGGFGQSELGSGEMQMMPDQSMLMMKHAVPLSAIRSLWGKPAATGKKNAIQKPTMEPVANE